MRQALPLLLLLAALGCRRVHYEDQVFSKPGVRYHIGAVPSEWRRVRLKGGDLAFSLDDSGHAMAVNATCEDYGDASLDTLTRHLLSGFTDRQEVSTEQVMLDGRAAQDSHVRARLDGVPVELRLIVLKKDACVFDFSYVSPLGQYEERLADFESLVLGFHTERTS